MKVSKIIEKDVIKDYLLGHCQTICSKRNKISKSSVRRILDKYNIKIRNISETMGITNLIKEKVGKLYNLEYKHKEISYLLNISKPTVNKILRELGLVKKRDKDSINEHYFDVIDTEDKAYNLGLFISDGFIVNNQLQIFLQEEDNYLLQNFLNCIRSNKRLYFRKKTKEHYKNQYGIIISSKTMIDSLSKYGMIPRKSHFTYFPEIPEHLWNHFIRGVFDGDGHIGVYDNQKKFTIAGNNKLIERIQEILIEECNLNKTNFGLGNNKKTVSLVYGGNIQVKRIFNYLYKDATIYMIRKEIKFK